MIRIPIGLAVFTVQIALTGCSPAEPPVYPVTGTVTLADGKSAAGCVVEFSSQADGTKGMNARGEVREDGTYQLTTTINGKEKAGAVA